MNKKPHKKRKRRLRALQDVWHRAIKPELDRLHRKIDKLTDARKQSRPAQIGFAPPSRDSKEEGA